jgi:hypothetical protein
VAAPIANEAPFCFAFMPDGALHLSEADFNVELGYGGAVRANARWRSAEAKENLQPAEIVLRQHYPSSPLWNSWAAVALLQMAYGTLPVDLNALLLRTDPGLYADYEQEVARPMNEFDRRRLVEHRLPVYQARLQRAAGIRQVRFLTEHTIRGEYDFSQNGFALQARQTSASLVAFTNKVRFPEPTFLGMVPREAEQLRRPNEQVSFVFEYRGNLVSADYQKAMAEQHGLTRAFAVELSSLTIHLVRQIQGDARFRRTLTTPLKQMQFAPER